MFGRAPRFPGLTGGRWVPWRGRVLAGAVLLLGVLLPGCVYLRLLDVKRQLNAFDENFAVGGRSELVIEFRNPVLRMKDARFLIGAEPLASVESPEEMTDHFAFSLLTSSGTPPPLQHLSLDLAYRDRRLTKIIVPEKFLLMFSRSVLVETLKQAKDAEVLETKRTARARVTLPPSVEAELPTLERTQFLLGESPEVVAEGDLTTHLYRYGIDGSKRPAPILARLSFDEAGFLRRAFVRWDQSSVEATFVRSEP